MKQLKKSVFCLFLSLLILVSVVSVNATTKIEVDDISETSIMNNEGQNPYVSGYVSEKGSIESVRMKRGNKQAIEKEVAEKQDTIDFLNDCYQKDLKTTNILKEYVDIEEQALSLEPEDKIFAMRLAIEVYPLLSSEEEQEILAAFMSRYAFSLNYEEAMSFLRERAEIKSSAPSKTRATNFNTTAAASWAKSHWNTFSFDFPRLTAGNFNDCTNFVSQALFVGGKAKRQRTWYCYKKNNIYLTPNNVDQLNTSWDLADPSPWISSKEFAGFWEGRGVIYDYRKPDDYVKNHVDLFNRNLAIRGDVLVLYKPDYVFFEKPDHVMIVTGLNQTGKDYLLSGHTTNRNDHPLLRIFSDNPGTYQPLHIISVDLMICNG